jgi:hypothetical protein
MASCALSLAKRNTMANLLEYVGNIHIFLGPYRGNPISLYLKRGSNGCEIAPKVYPWNEVVGKGETPNRAAADFEEKWKAKNLSAEMYTGPSWQGGIKPEKPAPPKPPPAAKPAAAAAAQGTEPKGADTTPAKPAATAAPAADKKAAVTPAATPDVAAAPTKPDGAPT